MKRHGGDGSQVKRTRMTHRILRKGNRIAAMLITVALLFPFAAVSSYAEEADALPATRTSGTVRSGDSSIENPPESEPETAGEGEVEENSEEMAFPGIFRIRNSASGKYLSVGKYSKSAAEITRLEEYSAGSGAQCFRITDPGDSGRWMMIPQTDSGKYALTLSENSGSGSLLVLAEADGREGQFFDILKLKNGCYTVAPSESSNFYDVLCGADAGDGSGKQVSGISDYSIGDPGAMWVFEPVLTTGISVAFRETKMQTGSTGRFYAKLMPYNSSERREVWTSDSPGVLNVSENGAYAALSEGTAHVTAALDGCSAEMTVTVTDRACFTFFSQNSAVNSDWCYDGLDTLYFNGGGYRKPFAIDDKAPGGKSAWIDKGCALCAVAMVLRNHDARLTVGYDFRSGQDGMLPADPYTVALANSGSTGALTGGSVIYGNPVYMAWSRAVSSFETGGQALAIKRVYTQNLATIRKLVEEHPHGIIAMLSRGESNHCVVIGRCINPEETVASKLQFEIFDPAAYLRYEGDGVLMSETTSARFMHYSFRSISQLIIIDTPDKLN